jgi:hypothetical protein
MRLCAWRADSPYPGKSSLYRGLRAARASRPRRLLSRLPGYDGWALCTVLSTSADALPAVLATAVALALEIRVAVWIRSPRPHAMARLLNGWEPVLFAGGRQLPGSGLQAVDALAGVAPRGDRHVRMR